MTLEEVQTDMPSWIQRAQTASAEIEKLKQQLATEKESVSEMSTELQILKGELENNRCESERLTAAKRGFDDRRRYMQPRGKLDLADAENVIAELEDELAYKVSVNRSLALQLEKTIESNSELLLEIKDLDDLLQSRDREIEKLKETDTEKLEEERASWARRLEESERVIEELRSSIEELAANQGTRIDTEEAGDRSAAAVPDAASEELRKELAKAETESAEVRQENMNLLSQLMNLRHQTDDKDALIQKLESELATYQDQEKKLQCTVNDLRDKLFQSEELSESQLESNKVFLVELNSTVEMLQKQKEELEVTLKSVEDDNASLAREVATLRKEVQEHEKERTLLVSLRGQMKALREKLNSVTHGHEAALKRIEDLEAENKALNERNGDALATLQQQAAENADKLHAMNLTRQGLENELAEVESRLMQKQQEVESLLQAKEAADASVGSLQATNGELQDRIDTLLASETNFDLSLKSMTEAHAHLEERLRESEQARSDASERLQEANHEIVRLKEDLEAAGEQLRQSLDKLAEADGATSALERKFQDAIDDKTMRINDLELQLSQTKQDIESVNDSLAASEARTLALQQENAGLADKLSDSVSERNAMSDRLEEATRREAESEKKVREMEQELLEIKNETHIYEETMAQLEKRLQFLSIEGVDQQEKMAAELQRLTASIQEMQSEKERAEGELQRDNAHLLQELSIWKDKAEAAEEEIRTWREKWETEAAAGGVGQVKQQRNGGAPSTSEERTTPKGGGAKKGTEMEQQKGEVVRLRKQAAELKKKQMEVMEERDEVKRKLAVLQKELQRKSDVLAATEKKLREKEREDHQQQQPQPQQQQRTMKQQQHPLSSRPNHHHHHHQKATMMSSSGPIMSLSAKTMLSLSEKVKSLEEQLNTKSVELAATKFVLKKKEEQLSSCFPKTQDEHGSHSSNNGDLVQMEQSPSEGNLSGTAGFSDSIQSDDNSLEEENRHLRKLLSQLNESLQKGNHAPDGTSSSSEQEERARNDPQLVAQLNEMRERYSQMSLKFAELQGEKEELILALKNGRQD